MRSTSLFAKRPSSKRKTPIQALMFLLLRRIALAPSRAWAAAASIVVPHSPALALGRRRILIFLRSTLSTTAVSLGNLNRKQVKRIFLVGLSIYAFMNVIESVMAHKRQKIDATSEWGRYADAPAARGMALTVTMMKLAPYTALPVIIEKITGRSKKSGDDYSGYNTKEEYHQKSTFAD